jgi:DNA-binding MarR family transcriptional regulator
MQRHENAEVFTEIVLEIFKLNGLLNIVGDELTKEFGLSSAKWKVLGAVYMSGTNQTVSGIAKSMGQSRQAVRKTVLTMHKNGFLILENNPNHKTSKLISLTQRGKDAYEQLDAKQIAWSNSCANTLDLQQLKSTIHTLKKISDDFEFRMY